MSDLPEPIKESVKDKVWWFRVPIIIFFIYIFIRHLGDADYRSIFWGLNLGIHEIGHFAFSYFGRFMEVLGGSLLQCLAPIFSIFVFINQRDFFAISVCFGWLSTNFFSVAIYVADARAMDLNLVTPFGQDAIHDWHYLLERLNMLELDKTFAAALRVCGVLSMLICLSGGIWMLWIIKKYSKL